MGRFAAATSLGNVRSGFPALNLAFRAWGFLFGNFRLGAFAWDVSLGMSRLGSLAWGLELGHLSLETSACTLSLSLAWYLSLAYHSFKNTRL